MIAYGNYIGQGLRYSTNFSGQEWSEPDLDLEGTGYLDAASDGQRIVAVGYSGDEFEQAIAVVTDGSTWSTTLIDAATGPAEQLTWAGGRFVAIGAQRAIPGRSWWSVDGLDWTSGPDVPFPPADPLPPEAGDDPFVHRTIGGGTPGVVLAQTYDDGLHVWFAPLSAFH